MHYFGARLNEANTNFHPSLYLFDQTNTWYYIYVYNVYTTQRQKTDRKGRHTHTHTQAFDSMHKQHHPSKSNSIAMVSNENDISQLLHAKSICQEKSKEKLKICKRMLSQFTQHIIWRLMYLHDEPCGGNNLIYQTSNRWRSQIWRGQKIKLLWYWFN